MLYLVDPIDEVAIQNLKSYKEKNFVDATKEDLDLGSETSFFLIFLKFLVICVALFLWFEDLHLLFTLFFHSWFGCIHWMVMKNLIGMSMNFCR